MAYKSEEKRKEQLQLQNAIVELTGINIVTCGMCGTVILHSIDQEEIECTDCDFISDVADFPDLNH